MKFSVLIFLISVFFVEFSSCVSLNSLICRRQPQFCQNRQIINSENGLPFIERSIPLTSSEKVPLFSKTYLTESNLDLPKRPRSFPKWAEYGQTADDGTGYGSGIGPGYGPGLGDIAVRTGVGIIHPFGSLGIRRDFELGFGGSGRFGGIPFGYGNGYSANGLATDLSGWPHSRPFTNGDYWPLG